MLQQASNDVSMARREHLDTRPPESWAPHPPEANWVPPNHLPNHERNVLGDLARTLLKAYHLLVAMRYRHLYNTPAFEAIMRQYREGVRMLQQQNSSSRCYSPCCLWQLSIAQQYQQRQLCGCIQAMPQQDLCAPGELLWQAPDTRSRGC